MPIISLYSQRLTLMLLNLQDNPFLNRLRCLILGFLNTLLTSLCDCHADAIMLVLSSFHEKVCNSLIFFVTMVSVTHFTDKFSGRIIQNDWKTISVFDIFHVKSLDYMGRICTSTFSGISC